MTSKLTMELVSSYAVGLMGLLRSGEGAKMVHLPIDSNLRHELVSILVDAFEAIPASPRRTTIAHVLLMSAEPEVGSGVVQASPINVIHDPLVPALKTKKEAVHEPIGPLPVQKHAGDCIALTVHSPGVLDKDTPILWGDDDCGVSSPLRKDVTMGQLHSDNVGIITMDGNQ